MQDLASSFSSVEDMLRWQIGNARKRAEEIKGGLNKHGDPYSLPKPTDGLPDSWASAFGKLTHQQVTLAHAFDGLKWCFDKIEKAESALSDGDLPTAIYWVIYANQSISSLATVWQSSWAVRSYRYVGKFRQRQKKIAEADRTDKPTKEELETFRKQWMSDKGRESDWGWLTAASVEYRLAPNTIKKIVKN